MNILDGSFGRVSIDHDNEYRSFWWGGKNTRVAFVHRFYAPIHSLRCIAVPSISCPLTSDDVPYSLHFALAYKITVHNIFGSETIIGIRCNSYEKSLFLNCKNKAIFLQSWYELYLKTIYPFQYTQVTVLFGPPFPWEIREILGKLGKICHHHHFCYLYAALHVDVI